MNTSPRAIATELVKNITYNGAFGFIDDNIIAAAVLALGFNNKLQNKEMFDRVKYHIKWFGGKRIGKAYRFVTTVKQHEANLR